MQGQHDFTWNHAVPLGIDNLSMPSLDSISVDLSAFDEWSSQPSQRASCPGNFGMISSSDGSQVTQRAFNSLPIAGSSPMAGSSPLNPQQKRPASGPPLSPEDSMKERKRLQNQKHHSTYKARKAAEARAIQVRIAQLEAAAKAKDQQLVDLARENEFLKEQLRCTRALDHCEKQLLELGDSSSPDDHFSKGHFWSNWRSRKSS